MVNMKRKAFTLIEMLIVLTVVSILIPTVFSIVYVIMRQQVRIYRVIETRRQGDSVLTFIKDRMVRSKQITNNPSSPPYTPRCATVGPPVTSSNNTTEDAFDIAFLDNDDNRYRIYLNKTTGNLMFQPLPGGTATPINNNLVSVSSFVITCARRAQEGAPLISISYTIQFKDTTAVEDVVVSLPYQTKIKLRE